MTGKLLFQSIICSILSVLRSTTATNFSRCYKTSFAIQSFLVTHQLHEYGKQAVKSQTIPTISFLRNLLVRVPVDFSYRLVFWRIFRRWREVVRLVSLFLHSATQLISRMGNFSSKLGFCLIYASE